MTLRLLLLHLIVLFLIHPSFSQKEDINRCNTVDFNNYLRSQYPGRTTEAEFEKWMQQRIDKLRSVRQNNPGSNLGNKYGIQTYTIPIIFHIIHDGESVGATPNIGSQYIDAQIEQLNLDFANLSGSTYTQASDVQIQFCAAKIDPQGNCLPEPGINRIDRNSIGLDPPAYNQTYFNTSIQPATFWNPDEYLNVWTADIVSFLGFAQLPEATYLQGVHDDNGPANSDGCIIKYSSIGSIAVPFPAVHAYNKGRTLTHEVGHWLGLRHIWGDGDCTKDDFCNDTPSQANFSSGCPIGNDSCPSEVGQDMVENYMDYTNDDCMNTFTEDQRDRMLVVMDPELGSIRRKTLNSSPACGCAPVADFTPSSSSLNICTSSNVIAFTNTSLRTSPSTTYSWTFSGAGVSPTSSNTENPTVSINSNGTLSASLSITTANGTDTKGPINIAINTISAPPGSPTLVSPPNSSTQTPLSPILNWNPVTNADSYFIEIATDPAMNSIVYVDETTNTTITPVSLNPTTTYYWRIIPINDCNRSNVYSGNSSTIWSFTTTNTTCNTYAAANMPIVLPTSGKPTVESTITIPAGLGQIADLNISKLSLEHTYLSDLTISLTSPNGTSALLVREICGSNDDINLIFDDAGSPNDNIPCPPTDGNAYVAQSPFLVFNGVDPVGDWTLTISDAAGGDGGQLLCWNLEICTEDVMACPGSLATSLFKTDVDCFGQSTGSVTASPSGGVTPYSYIWQNSLDQSVGTTATIPSLAADTYTVFITDSNNCVISQSIQVSQPATAITASYNVTDVSCFGGTDGTLTANPTGGTAPYSYNWSTGATLSTINGLSVGTYTVTIKDNNDCSLIQNLTISQPTQLTHSSTSTQVSCNGFSDGEILLSVAGGSVPYSYNWSTGNSTSVNSGLIAGSYTVTITDDNLCNEIANFTITEPAVLSVNETTADVLCAGGNDGSVALSLSGGTAPYQYNWSNGNSTNTNTGLIAGNYSVTITDDNLCILNANYTVTEPLALSMSESIADVNCTGGNDGSVTLTIAGGTVPYQYDWSNGATTSSITNLIAGTYTTTITDDNQCTITGSYVVNEPSQQLSLMLQNQEDVSCNGDADGELEIQIAGGTAPYQINWSNSVSTAINSNLVAGSYDVTITDDNSCTVIDSWTILEPTSLTGSIDQVFDATCFDAADGQANAVGGGGTSPYTYIWSSGETTQMASSLPAGNASVTITDSQMCTAIEQVTISGPTALVISIDQITDTNCPNSSDGSGTVSATGGIGPYSFSWSNSTIGPSITNVTSGSYLVTVTDDQSCQEVISVVVGAPVVTIDVTTVSPTCVGESDGSASVLVTGGAAPYTYTWSTGNTTANLTNAVAGTYSLSIDDDNGCSFTEIITIAAPQALQIQTSVQDLSCGLTANGSVFANTTGGTGPYTYSWEDANGNSSPTTNLPVGTYFVTATDANNCSIQSSAILAGGITEYTMANGNMLTGVQNDNADFEVDGEIESDQLIDATGKTIDYDSGISVTLKPGFEVKKGSIVHAFIDGCAGSM